jgi:DHA1 family bicyclomycin/chloramphenicol resistance-like MFS transporter
VRHAFAPDSDMLPRKTLVLLGAVAALGSLSTQLLVPALPTIADELAIGAGPAQLVIGVFLLGLGVGQLLVGPISDRVDRRRLLICGLALFAAGSLAAGLARSFEFLLLARLLQALGGSVGLVTARVMLNAMVPPERAVAAQASLMAIVLVSPALAPVLGGLLTEWLGWRAIMALLCAGGLVAAWAVLQRIRLAPTPAATARAGLGIAYRRVLRNRRFLCAALAMTFGSAVLYLFLGAAPFVLETRYGLTPRETGLALLLMASASIAGTRLVGRVQRWTDPLRLGGALGLLAVATLGAVSLTGAPALVLLALPLVLLGLTAGLIGPTALAHILASEPGLEGTATSVAGALQMAGSALFAWLFGAFAAQGTGHLAVALAPLSGAAAVAAFLVTRPDRG